jgi:murein DD-endopeptidase MepM/ murein hydrolase activator NlpD
VAGTAKNRVFSKRDRKHVLILASGDDVRHMTVRPWMAGMALSLAAVLSLGYLAATSYLVMRDDLIGASMSSQANVKQDYEDRISALRAQVDRITSRQLLDQQVVEKKVEKLLQQQLALSSRHGAINTLIDRAENSGLLDKPALADPGNAKPDDRAQADPQSPNMPSLIAAVDQPDSPAFAGTNVSDSVADRADRLFSAVTFSLKKIEQDQLTKINALAKGAATTADAILSIMRRTGVEVADVETDDSEGSVGGPYLAPVPENRFDASLGNLDIALQRLEMARKQVKALPFANPAPGKTITSTFGNRVDPFFGTLAMHAGVDFRQPVGAPIRSTGDGKVTVAGPNGSYGNMVEITHANGIVTRYGHLSRVIVTVGSQIEEGDIIGEAGSTGRSTGPHLHYEVRRNDVAVDPIRFLNAGAKLESLLN